MNDPRHRSNGDSSLDPSLNENASFQNFSTDRIEAAKKQASRWFVILLTVGLILGAILSVGLVKLLNQLGLTEKPNSPLKIEQPKNQ